MRRALTITAGALILCLALNGCTTPPPDTTPLPPDQWADSEISPTGRPNDPGPRPVRTWRGQYTCILDSIRTNQVTEIKLTDILKWGYPKRKQWEGYTYWTIHIEREPSVVFGMRYGNANAFIRNDKVHFWRYVGSDEVVP